MRFTGSVSVRPVRLGFLIPPDDLGLASRVARLSACVWGGRYNVMIPYFESGGERWIRPYHREGGLDVARGYINFFEPDTLVESTSGMAERLGWSNEGGLFELPRIVSLHEFFGRNDRGPVEFAAGINIMEVMQQLYDEEYKYERRHKRPFALVDNVAGNAFFDVVGGRYPDDEAMGDIREGYVEVFSPEKLPATADTASKMVAGGYAGPFWITRHRLEESIGRGIHAVTFYVFDPSDAGDVIDYWNHRLIDGHVIPISVDWMADHSQFIRDNILHVHRPIPGNPFGTKFFTSIHFASSISDDRARDLIVTHMAGLPERSFLWGRDPTIWRHIGRGHERRETKILVTSKATPFDEEVGEGTYVRLPAPIPPFFDERRYIRDNARWVNLIVPEQSIAGSDSTIVYPSNLWQPDYPRLAVGESLRIGREGWALSQHHSIGHSLIQPQEGREAIIGWLKTKRVEARPSEEGQVAAQVIAAAGGLLACGMFADKKTIVLLNEMAESHADVTRTGKRVEKAAPDRSKHINTVRQHFGERAKRSFGYWNKLDYFLNRSVFRAGLRVQCPVCAYYNWFDLDAIGYIPKCNRCLNSFKFSQTPTDLHNVDWFYRVVGPFAAPDYARGGYAVALSLRCIGQHRDAEMTWTTGLKLHPLNCEVDFMAWHRPRGLLRDERDEPLLVMGEAKSFGKNSINEDVANGLRKVADLFPGAIMIVSSLREIGDYTQSELQLLRDLALWGRRDVYEDKPRNPLVILTATELFAEHGIFDAWKQIGQPVHPSINSADLYTLAELTQRRYLGLPGFWEERMSMVHQRRRILRMIQGRAQTC
jgi:hypothetical protein